MTNKIENEIIEFAAAALFETKNGHTAPWSKGDVQAQAACRVEAHAVLIAAEIARRRKSLS
jgi:hypothetical protein